MSKPKTKMCVMDTKATETAPGHWVFITGRFEWLWQGGVGLNLFVREGEESWASVIYAGTLGNAIMFAHGYESGHANGRKMIQVTI